MILKTPLCSGFGQWHTDQPNSPNPKPYNTITLENIFSMAEKPTSTAKENAAWFVPSSLLTREATKQRKNGVYFAVWCDFDNHTELSAILAVLAVLGCGYLVYSSRSATTERQKWRVIIFLATPATATEWQQVAAVINDRFAAAGIVPDRASERVNQICYLPNRGEFYQFHIEQGALLDWQSVLADELTAKKHEAAKDQARLNAVKEQSRIKAVQRMATASLSPIEAYNAAYPVVQCLELYGYKQKGNKYLSPNSESGNAGVTVKGDKWLSSHSSDLGIGNPNPNGGGCYGDAFDLFTHYEHGGDRNAAIKAAGAMFSTSNGKTLTQANQQAHMEQQHRAAKEPISQAVSDPLFPMVNAKQLTAHLIKITWLLANIIEYGSLSLLFGEPGAGKSLFALEWAFCIAAGIGWNGYRTLQTDVVIVAGEGFAGLARRLKALEAKYQCTAPERLFITQRPADFIDSVNINWLADTLKTTCPNAGLVIIDTMHRNMTGDENSSQDIGRFINNIDLYLKPLGAAVLIVHHSGHSIKDRSRGSSSIRAAMDGEFSATKSNDSITLACHKAKDFEALKPLSFALKPVELIDWLDDDGEPMTSVFLEHTGTATPSNKRRLSARDDAILQTLNDAIAAHGIEPTAEIKAKFSLSDKLQKVVSIEHWRTLAYKAIVTDTDTIDAKKKAFKRCRDKLLNQSFIVEYDNYAWRIF